MILSQTVLLKIWHFSVNEIDCIWYFQPKRAGNPMHRWNSLSLSCYCLHQTTAYVIFVAPSICVQDNSQCYEQRARHSPSKEYLYFGGDSNYFGVILCLREFYTVTFLMVLVSKELSWWKSDVIVRVLCSAVSSSVTSRAMTPDCTRQRWRSRKITLTTTDPAYRVILSPV